MPELSPRKNSHASFILICGAAVVIVGLAAAYHAFGSRLRRPVPMGPRAGEAAPPSLAGLPKELGRVAWRPWGPELFHDAAAKDRLILLDLTAPWSHWARLMELKTYGDEQAARWVGAHVVPLQLDADARPDLARRYDSAIPTTALLLPSGELLASGAYIPPEMFVPWATRVTDAYARSKGEVLAARDGARKGAEVRRLYLLGPGRSRRWDALSAEAKRMMEEGYVRQALVVVARADGGERRLPLPAVHRFLAESAVTKAWRPEGSEVSARARRMLAGMAKLEDPAWGGIFRYSRCPDWTCPEREKLLSTQAAVIEDGVLAARAGFGAEWLALAGRTADFVEKRMAAASRDAAPEPRVGAAEPRVGAPEVGRYFSALGADVWSEKGWVDGDAYYALSDAGRRAMAPPAARTEEFAAPLADLASGAPPPGRAQRGARSSRRPAIGGARRACRLPPPPRGARPRLRPADPRLRRAQPARPRDRGAAGARRRSRARGRMDRARGSGRDRFGRVDLRRSRRRDGRLRGRAPGANGARLGPGARRGCGPRFVGARSVAGAAPLK
ncbi:MAG: DUF255 domain-containing protein [Elusimicrobia bacterium]|nr:DUF255 domain-containing protein [Elusimicrobiota bacterium]